MAEIEERLRSDGFNEEAAERVVTTREPKPITIKEASEVFNVPEATIRGWIHRGHLASVGRIKYPAPGGGKVLVDSAQVEELTVSPPVNGRPPKKST